MANRYRHLDPRGRRSDFHDAWAHAFGQAHSRPAPPARGTTTRWHGEFPSTAKPAQVLAVRAGEV